MERCTTHCKHDWKKCPFSHPTENARRRDPRLHNYIPESCPNYKELGACSWGALLPGPHQDSRPLGSVRWWQRCCNLDSPR